MRSLTDTDLVPSPEIFRKLLGKMKYCVRIPIFAGLHAEPQLSHEKDLVGVVRNCAITGRPSLLYPVSQIPDEVKEEVIVRDGYDFVCYLDKDGEP